MWRERENELFIIGLGNIITKEGVTRYRDVQQMDIFEKKNFDVKVTRIFLVERILN